MSVTDNQIRELLCEPTYTQIAAEALGQAFAVMALGSPTERKARRAWARAYCISVIDSRSAAEESKR